MNHLIYKQPADQVCSEKLLYAPDHIVEELNQLLEESVLSNPRSHWRIFGLLEELSQSLLSQSKSDRQASFVKELFSLCRSRLEYEFRFIGKLETRQIVERASSAMLFQTTLSYRQIQMIRFLTYMKRRKLVVSARKGLRRRDELTVDSGLTVFCVRHVLNVLFKFSGLLNKLQETFPASMTVTGVAIEHSTSGSTWWKSSSEILGTPETDYIHIDEALEAPKAILYLSEVNEPNGPTEFFPGLLEHMSVSPIKQLIGRVIGNIGSMQQSPLYGTFGTSGQRTSSSEFRTLLWSLPESLRFNSHFGWDISPNNSLVAEINRRRFIALGGPGTLSVFDGSRVAHRGGLIQDGERVVLQIVFGVTDRRFWQPVLSRLGSL